MTEKKTYRLNDLVAQCDPGAPMPEAVQEWDQAVSVGLEQTVMGDQVDIRNAVLVFHEKLANQFDAIQLILFGSRARVDYHDESDADVAVILAGQPRDFVDTKLAMAAVAFDVLTETGILIQALPVWESEWANPEDYFNPDLLQNITRDGIVLWLAT
ncbi:MULTISPECIES: nucleotidyltransferase domain-containing protein [Marinobacter]|uniref:nucleotidyltransferase domain-containing protein n=1 Tax=Marinobacter TaxID=2742 RepID=UPI001244722B|nr:MULTISPECIES: nucleotidyltransferase domain-containing protein [Marinobacter]MBL3557606.1 nucleotidyltransferase domain-containing protein [Marinobacter sp. JB05H06]